MQNNKAFNQLLQMGCNPTLIEASIRQLKTDDAYTLLDWISDHGQEQQKWAQWLKDNQQQKPIVQQSSQLGQSIEPLINKPFREQLIKKGHSKNSSEKALLFTNNVSVQSAEKWLDQHKYDADFEQELKLQGQAYNESKLSPQEARAKLDELTKKARQVRIKRQEEEAREREKNRVKFGKQMQDAKRLAQEVAMKRKVELDKIQKKRDQDYKKKLLEQMRIQRNAKLGLKDEPSVNATQTKKQAYKLSSFQQIELQCEQVKVGNHAYPEVAKTFFETAQIYINNIIKNNGQQKFRKINKQNKAFQNRICAAFGGLQLLTVLGYKQEDNTLFLKQYDLGNLKKVSDLLERYKSYY